MGQNGWRVVNIGQFILPDVRGSQPRPIQTIIGPLKAERLRGKSSSGQSPSCSVVLDPREPDDFAVVRAKSDPVALGFERVGDRPIGIDDSHESDLKVTVV